MTAFVSNTRYRTIVNGNRVNFVTKKLLPYDAEIEYLQSTGSQYIDTGIFATTETSISIKIQRTATSTADQVPLGSRGPSHQYDFSVWTNTSSGKGIAVHKFFNGNAGAANREDSGWKYTGNIINDFHVLDVTSQGYYVDGTLCHSWTKTPQSLATSTIPIYLFIMNDNQVMRAHFYGKIAFVKIWLSGVLAFNAIPVRVGQIGYLYNKVSRTLFGNDGTGSFTLGPDKN